jgi:sugar phosphate isomerase/epimerase
VKFSLCSANFGNVSLKKSIERAAELGFDGIEITVMFHARPTINIKERKNIKKWISDSGIECSALHFIFDKDIKLASEDEIDIENSITHIKSVIDLAVDIGTNVIVVGGGGSRSTKSFQNKSEIEKNLIKIFSITGGYALEKNVFLAIEALNRYETNFINTLKEAKHFADKTNCPNIKIMGDTFHMNIEEISIPQAIEETDENLIHLHFADSNRLAPGEGHIDFKSIIHTLKNKIYKGFCSFEVFAISPDLLHFNTYEEADRHMKLGKSFIDKLIQ